MYRLTHNPWIIPSRRSRCNSSLSIGGVLPPRITIHIDPQKRGFLFLPVPFRKPFFRPSLRIDQFRVKIHQPHPPRSAACGTTGKTEQSRPSPAEPTETARSLPTSRTPPPRNAAAGNTRANETPPSPRSGKSPRRSFGHNTPRTPHPATNSPSPAPTPEAQTPAPRSPPPGPLPGSKPLPIHGGIYSGSYDPAGSPQGKIIRTSLSSGRHSIPQMPPFPAHPRPKSDSTAVTYFELFVIVKGISPHSRQTSSSCPASYFSSRTRFSLCGAVIENR